MDKPPCGCIEKVGDRFVVNCDCGKYDDAAWAGIWCGEQRAAAQLAAKDKEIAELKHDLGNYMTIANTEANEAEQLRATIARLREALESAKAQINAAEIVGARNEAGYLTDRALWAERAITTIDAALTEERG